jgi:hypothetical protein
VRSVVPAEEDPTRGRDDKAAAGAHRSALQIHARADDPDEEDRGPAAGVVGADPATGSGQTAGSSGRRKPHRSTGWRRAGPRCCRCRRSRCIWVGATVSASAGTTTSAWTPTTVTELESTASAWISAKRAAISLDNVSAALSGPHHDYEVRDLPLAVVLEEVAASRRQPTSFASNSIA